MSEKKYPFIEDWLFVCEEIKRFQKSERKLYERAVDMAVIPNKLRKAKPEDIVEGNIIWYMTGDYGEPHWHVVENVLYPHDNWKAYEAEDGCRYGLDGAVVEIK